MAQSISDKDGKYVGVLKGGLREGHGTMKWRNGNVYEGEWRHGKMTGHGKLSFPDGAAFSTAALQAMHTSHPAIARYRCCIRGHVAGRASPGARQLCLRQRQRV